MVEGGGQDPHQLRFVFRQGQGILRVYRGEAGVGQGIGVFPDGDFPVPEVGFFKEPPVVHAVFRVSGQQLSFQLALDHRNGLVHFGGQLGVHGIVYHIVQRVGHESGAGVVPVDFRRKDGQRTQVQTVPVFQHIIAVVGQGNADDVGDEGRVAGGRTHPGNVVVAPLDVDMGEAHQLVHDLVRPGPSVENIPDDVEPVDGQGADQGAGGDDKLLRNAGIQNGSDDFVVVEVLVHVVGDVQQLVQNIGKAGRHFGTDFTAGVLGGNGVAHHNQPVHGDPAPFVRQLPHPPEPFDFFLGPIDQHSQGFSVVGGNAFVENQVDFGTDHPGSGTDQFQKGVVLPMQIAEKIFRPLGQRTQG